MHTLKKTFILVLTAILLVGCFSAVAEYDILQVGSKGEAVKQLQQALIDQGFLTGGADGIFGNGTAGGVKKFQESAGLEATGIADNETQRHLYGDAELDGIEIKFSGVTETDHYRIDGFFVDEGYVNPQDDRLARVVLCYSAFTKDQNLTVSGDNVTLTFVGGNSYESIHDKSYCLYLDSYYYGGYAQQVYVGEEVKVVETFNIPRGELSEGRDITLSHSFISDFATFTLNTDDLLRLKNIQTIAKLVDPEGYKQAIYDLAEADSNAASKVRKEINGYYYDVYVQPLSYRIEFYKNTYDIYCMGISSSGKYSIRNGYVVLTNDSTGAQNFCPYKWVNGVFDFDIADGFDYSEG